MLVLVISKTRMETIYILELENNKYYVGVSNNHERRIERHMNGNGSEWTKLYKPIRIIDTHEKQSQFDEDNTTKQLMIEYGIENVRGGSYCKIELEEWQIRSLEAEFRGIANKCYKCGKMGHYASACSNKVNKYNNLSIEELEKLKDELLVNIQNIEEVNNGIIKYDINFTHFIRALGTLAMRCIYDDLRLVTFPLCVDFEDKILKIVKSHTKYPDKFNKIQIEQAKKEIEQATNTMLQNIRCEIDRLSNYITDNRINVRLLLINNKNQTIKLNKLLNYEGKTYNKASELVEVIKKDVEEILDTILVKLDESTH